MSAPPPPRPPELRVSDDQMIAVHLCSRCEDDATRFWPSLYRTPSRVFSGNGVAHYVAAGALGDMGKTACGRDWTAVGWWVEE